MYYICGHCERLNSYSGGGGICNSYGTFSVQCAFLDIYIKNALFKFCMNEFTATSSACKYEI